MHNFYFHQNTANLVRTKTETESSLNRHKLSVLGLPAVTKKLIVLLKKIATAK